MIEEVTEADVAVMRQRLRRFFWCDGACWGGYARFFEPTLPSRIGRELIAELSTGLDKLDIKSLTRARNILSVSHRKEVWKRVPRKILSSNQRKRWREVCHGTTMCRPTKAAHEGVYLINQLLTFLYYREDNQDEQGGQNG